MDHPYSAPKRGLGQNFLVSPAVARRIVSALPPATGELVFEIGPGYGALTVPLAESGARIVAYEIDGELADRLGEQCMRFKNVEIRCDDIRNVDLDGVAAELTDERYKIIGNIPYHLTGSILLDLPRLRRCEVAVLMVQREVGERILASPGDRACGMVTVFLRSYLEISRVMRVRPGSFRPRPKVESMVLRFTATGFDTAPADRDKFLAFLKWSFSQRRKKLRSVYRRGRGMVDATDFYVRAAADGCDLDRRPEELPLEDWFRLFSVFRESAG
ncbi:MAG: ribosomal RNA small subunit methyltransferase A [bacterium]|nr:MAG: ribosomal RNA small subunit methyltransferase A [bacterium]